MTEIKYLLHLIVHSSAIDRHNSSAKFNGNNNNFHFAFTTMLLPNFWRSVIMSLVLTLSIFFSLSLRFGYYCCCCCSIYSFFLLVINLSLVPIISYKGLNLQMSHWKNDFFFALILFTVKYSVPRWTYSPAFEKSYNKPWSRWCHCCRLQCCNFGILDRWSK